MGCYCPDIFVDLNFSIRIRKVEGKIERVGWGKREERVMIFIVHLLCAIYHWHFTDVVSMLGENLRR